MRNRVILALTLALAVPACSVESAAPSDEAPAELASQEQAAKSVSVFHSNWSGGSASGSVSGDTSWLSFDAWESASGQIRTAALQFWGYGYDPASEVCQTETICWGGGGSDAGADGGTGGSTGEICEEYTWCYYTHQYWTYGWGEFPSEDFGVGGQARTARLQVDLANAPNFYSSRCEYDGSTYTCAPTTGAFDVTWSSNRMYSQSFNGVQAQTWGAYSSRSSGQYDSRSADVTGVALGSPVSPWGGISQSRGTGVSKDVYQN